MVAVLLAPAALAQPAATAPEDRPPHRPPEAELSPQGDDEPAGRPPETPDAQPLPPAPAAPAAPAADAGPPQRERLRESDFDLSACLLALRVMGARYDTADEITGEQRDCGIARPVILTEALPGLVLEGAPPMRCETARALGWWLRDHVIPSAARLPGAPRPVSLVPGSTYQCRGVVGDGDAGALVKLSEHAFGNAIDIAALRFDSGETIEVARATGNDLAAAFLAAIRGTACLYFTTVLGPGANAAHGDHLHLDIKARNGGYRLCQ